MAKESNDPTENIAHFVAWVESLPPGDPMRGPMRHAVMTFTKINARVAQLDADQTEMAGTLSMVHEITGDI